MNLDGDMDIFGGFVLGLFIKFNLKTRKLFLSCLGHFTGCRVITRHVFSCDVNDLNFNHIAREDLFNHSTCNKHVVFLLIFNLLLRKFLTLSCQSFERWLVNLRSVGLGLCYTFPFGINL